MTPTTQTKCKAKNPRTCSYHGAVIRMGEAEKAGDFDTYFLERFKVEEAERKGWVDEQLQKPSDNDLTVETIREELFKEHSIDDLIDYTYDNATFETKLGPLTCYDLEEGYEDGPSQTVFVFILGGRYWHTTGTYSSYDGTDWDEYSLREVRPEKSLELEIRTKYAGV